MYSSVLMLSIVIVTWGCFDKKTNHTKNNFNIFLVTKNKEVQIEIIIKTSTTTNYSNKDNNNNNNNNNDDDDDKSTAIKPN